MPVLCAIVTCMELRRIIWSWDMLTRRLMENEPDLGRAVFRSCRPVAAQRYRDGRLLVVLGCWWPDDLEYLSREANRSRLNSLLSGMLSEQVITNVVRWPGGMAAASTAVPEGEQIPARDVLSGLPEEAREEASKCESAIQRLFFARAYARGLRPRCQYPLLTFRLDFALPDRRGGADILGWHWRTGPSGANERIERQQQLEAHGWKILLFSGSQVLSNADKCVAEFATLSQSGFVQGQQPLPTRYSPEAREPFSSLGKRHPTNGRPHRPGR